MGNIENFTYNNSHLKYHVYCKYHDISKLVVTLQEALELVEFITNVEKSLVFLIHKPYKFYDVDINFYHNNDISVLKNLSDHGT